MTDHEDKRGTGDLPDTVAGIPDTEKCDRKATGGLEETNG